MISRRRFLQGSLLVLGLGACRRSSSPRSGAFRGVDVSGGHRLRDGSFATVPSPETVRVKTAVLGAGVAGLSAAWKLERSGWPEVQVIELEKEAGGNARASRYPVTPAPLAAHYLPVPTRESRAVRELLVEMQLMEAVDTEVYDVRHLCHAPRERLWYAGRWHEGLFPLADTGRDEQDQFERFQETMEYWKSWRDGEGRRAFALPIELSSREPELLELDRLSFADYADQQGWNAPLLRWYLDYACLDDYGSAARDVSAWAGVHYFACRDGGGFSPPDSLFTWPEGNQRLVAHLLKCLSRPLWARHLVLEVHPGSPVRIELLDLASDRRRRVLADTCIYALPSFQRRLHFGKGPGSEFVYPPWVTANLVLDRPPREADEFSLPAWDNVLFGSPSLGYVVATHQDLRQSWRHPSVWTWYRPFAGEEPSSVRRRLLEDSLGFWQDQVLKDLAPVHSDLERCLRRLDVALLGHGMIRPGIGFVWGQGLARARQPLENVWFAHSDLSGVSLFEQAQYRGVLAAQQVMASGGHPHSDSLRPL